VTVVGRWFGWLFIFVLAVLAVLAVFAVLAVLPGCSSDNQSDHAWVDDDVAFVADGLTIHGTYHHQRNAAPGPAALLISESGRTDRNGDNAVAGPIGNMRQLAQLLSDRGVASLRYDKVGTGSTGLGPYASHPTEVGSAIYTSGAKSAIRFLADQPGTDRARLSVYALGEGTIHAMALAVDVSAGAPKIHSLGLLQPLGGRYLDLITSRVQADVDGEVKSGAKSRAQGDQTMAAWTAAVNQARASGTAPAQLPEGLNAVLNPGNVKAVVEADAIDPLALAAQVPAATPVLLTCSDSDGQATCQDERALIGAFSHTALDLVELKGVNHVLRDDPTDNVSNYAKNLPLSPQLVTALNAFATR
jgi:hypothetical protein